MDGQMDVGTTLKLPWGNSRQKMVKKLPPQLPKTQFDLQTVNIYVKASKN